jgi:hypothetical protein
MISLSHEKIGTVAHIPGAPALLRLSREHGDAVARLGATAQED